MEVLPLVVLYLVLAAIAQIGYKMVMSSLFLHSYPAHGQPKCVVICLGTLSIVVSGQSFPVEVLPKELVAPGNFNICPAQGFIGARLLLAPETASSAPFWPHLGALLLHLAIYGGLGFLLVTSGIRQVRREGLVQLPPA